MKINSSRFPKLNTNIPAHPAKGSIGLDLEWDGGRISVIGLADSTGAYSDFYYPPEEKSGKQDKLVSWLAEGEELVGHNIIQADILVLFKELPYPIVPEKKFDTLIYFYLTNPHLCKAREEKPDEQEGEKRGGGFMNIWTMASLYTNLPNWKECREEKYWPDGAIDRFQCEGPCPDHNILWYNSIDALAPLLARDKLLQDARIKKVDHLYMPLEKASWVAAMMRERGILIDIPNLERLEKQHDVYTTELKKELPEEFFGKEGGVSPYKVPKYFKDKYGVSPESTSEEDIRRFYEEYGHDEAGKLVELKEAGRGFKAWFDRRFIDSDDCIHPNFYPAGATATGRWASSNPNFQNMPRRRSKDIRRIVIPRPGYTLYKADYKQAEARVVLYQAGYKVPTQGFKEWLTETINLSVDDEGVRRLGGVWDAIKSFMHAGHYGEGLILIPQEKLKGRYYQDLISKGALEVYDGWTFQGQAVAFTGVNLAQRMFGRAGTDERAKAISLQGAYFGKYPLVRDWQRGVTKKVEQEGQVRSLNGHLLEVYGWPKDMIKTGLAMLGSNPVAFYTTLAVVRAYDDGEVPLAQVHDELVFEFPSEMPQDKAIDKIRSYMEVPHESTPDLILPIDISRGVNWADTEKIYG